MITGARSVEKSRPGTGSKEGKMILETSHFRPGADTNHFIGRCQECDLHYVARMSLGRVERAYHYGQISQDLYEAYMYVWTTSVHHYGTQSDWTPSNEMVRDLAGKLKKIKGLS